MSRTREVWVDYVKVFACILVVMGHFFQSMVKSDILSDSNLYNWFNTTIYYFHVPLFFICSGYLYQRYSSVDNISGWKQNVIKKAVILGIPYFVFSLATWLFKTVLSGSVNTEAGGLAETLFIHPSSPYWYLYILFMIFLLTPTIKSAKGVAVLTGIALIAKAIRITWGEYGVFQIFTVSNFTANWIWFVLGMMIAVVGTEKIRRPKLGCILSVTFFVLSVLLYRISNGWLSFGLGLVACTGILMISIGARENNMLDRIAAYTMPIFLIHTLLAAPVRILLMRFGINNVIVQIVVGLIISFVGPVVGIEVLKLIRLDWIVYPGRLLKKTNELSMV